MATSLNDMPGKMPGKMTVKPLSHALGAEVRGIDAAILDDTTFSTLR